jgi:DedD protein
MAFFKFRKNGAEQSGPSPVTESLEVLRKRARHRLIGAAALVLVGVVGFPLLFDSQPRPIAVDIAIDIPDKTKTAPLGAAPASTPAAALASVPASAASSAPASDTPTVIAVPDKPSPTVLAPAASAAVAKSQPKPEAKTEVKAEAKAEVKPEPKADTKAASKPDGKTSQGDKAQALLDGKDPAKSATPAAPRYTVQVGAFADAQKAQEARTALEKAGIKTYTQVVVTADGKRTRVRAGPWQDRAEAEKTAEKIKKLNLSASVLTL